MGLPTITINFKTLADSVLVRSSRGILAVIIKDGTSVSWTSKAYATLAEFQADAAAYDANTGNYDDIARAFLAGPNQVLVVRVGSSGTISDATAILDKLSYHWVCTNVAAFQAGLVTYVKAANAASNFRKVKCVTTGQSSVNDPHIVNVANGDVTLADASSTEVDMDNYLPRIGGILTACPLDESVTYSPLTDLAAADPVSNVGTSIDAGNLVLYLEDEAIRIARGVTTLVTPGAGQNSDMKKIAIVEAMDMIQEDIVRTWKNNYLGKVKNSADNQALFVSDVLTYLRALAAQNVLDPDIELSAEVDVDKMRTAWETAGTDVSDLTDAQVKRKTFRTYVYVKATMRILDAMEDLVMDITLQ